MLQAKGLVAEPVDHDTVVPNRLQRDRDVEVVAIGMEGQVVGLGTRAHCSSSASKTTPSPFALRVEPRDVAPARTRADPRGRRTTTPGGFRPHRQV